MLRRIQASSSQAKSNPKRRNTTSLREALAAAKSSRSISRSNGAARRRNASSAKPTLREVLSRHKARRNPELLDRQTLIKEVDSRTEAYEAAVKRAKSSPMKINKKIVERQRELYKV